MSPNWFFSKYCKTNIPEAVCLPVSKAAVPITQMAPVDFATFLLPGENGSPVCAGEVINGQDETILDASLSVNLTDPLSAFSSTILDDPVPPFH
ncbi:hypothetical protein TNCT_510011 [Trichonephila clavata]|uniref:Uncharacterized protein n=1 Tax=Trichonephila clavata TaxID=2740835 RepID=A0A8X6LA87_TRICU|nr:hypothetical protein TNCT_510011 [Trichonephila clavata]